MRGRNQFVTPFVLPVASFLVVILMGGTLLSLPLCATGVPVPFVDALFIATSAVCVTGLATVDVFTVFNRTGQCVVLFLIQLGGIGIVTYTTLILYMVARRISLRDRLAVTQGLLYSPNFNLGRFLQRMLFFIMSIEALGAAFLWYAEPERIGLFNAVFLSISAFCNAGFAPWPDSLARWQGDWAVTMPIMLLIVLGGMGFFVVNDAWHMMAFRIRQRLRNKPSGLFPATREKPVRLTFYSWIVLSTTFLLLLGGTGAIFFAELGNNAWAGESFAKRVLVALFQSTTSRTAGFATVDLALFSDVTLLATIILMLIGGSPGSCAGGIKTTAFRILCSNLIAHLRGNPQIVVSGRAMDAITRSKAVLLFSYSLLTIVVATLALSVTENGFAPHKTAALSFMDILFEVVSAFATVGLSINVTPGLSTPGKLILCAVMFIGRLGPVWLVTTIQQFQTETAFRHCEDSLPIG